MTQDSSQANDLGLGRVLSDDRRNRMLNRDGTFNVERVGVGFWRSHSLYHDLTAMSWPWFFAMLAASYLGMNALFAAGFWALGPAALDAPAADGAGTGFLRAFYFSVQTFATIGYGRISPVSHAAEMLVTVEAFLGIVYVALATGLIFARFSRPSPDVRFSSIALIAPYQDGWALMFRLANARRANLVDLSVQVTYSILHTDPHDVQMRRRYQPLALERDAVNVFPTTWTVVHAIGPDSPLYGLTDADLREGDVEVFVRLAALDEATMQPIQTRTSYRADEDEVIWNARFRDLHDRSGPHIRVDVTRLDEHDPVA
ncbi:MAG: transporter [Rhodothermales bacterium]|nr:transporter [Rhodothermales bacterium]MCA0268709.1 transporter [Bacteroidota bacterium]